MKKRGRVILLAAVLALILSGCGFGSPEELYTLPKTSAEYESLQESLEELLDQGYEYAAPTSGSNTQSVQLEDLDGDGEDEAVAFFRDSSGEHPLKICVFRANEEGDYELAYTIEGDGDAIASVVYCQLNDRTDSKGNKPEEIVVGWRISSSVYTLSAYSVENDNVTQLMSVPSYTRYAVIDLDQDNQSEIVCIQMNSVEEGGNTASYYDWSEDTMMSINTVSLSVSVESVESLRSGYLVSSYPALYINGVHREDSSLLITDILTVSEGNLVNITMDSELGDSDTTHLAQISLTDINSDNVLELPMTFSLKSSSALDGSDGFNAINWVQYTSTGRARSVGCTYHNTADGWYFTLPTTWVNSLILARYDTNVGATVERSITFYYQADVEDEPEPFLTIYKNTGTNRDARAVMGERFLLTEDSEATYSAELLSATWDCGLDEKDIAERFSLILTEWIVE